MRVQIVLRDAVVEYPHGNDARRTAIALALVEAESGELRGEETRNVRFYVSSRGLSFGLGTEAAPVNDDYDDERPVPDADITSVLTSLRVASPTGFEALLGFGKLTFRGTAFPGIEGREMFVAAGILVGANVVPDRTMIVLEGSPSDLRETSRRADPTLFATGDAVVSAFRTPVWGFDGEPRAIMSTMEPSIVARCVRHAVLVSKPDLTPDEILEIADLEKLHVVRNMAPRTDETYASFRRFAAENGYLDRFAFGYGDFPTAAQVDAGSAAIDEAMVAWLAAEDEASAGMRI